MYTYTVQTPMSSLDDLEAEFESISEVATTLDEEAALVTDLAFRLFVTNTSKDIEYNARAYSFLPSIHGKLYRLPNNDSEHISELDRYYYLGKSLGSGARLMPLETYGYITTEGVQFIRVNQQSMVELVKASPNVLFATLSECSVLIGCSDSSIFFAHIGYGERGNVEEVVNTLKDKGVDAKHIVAVIMDKPRGAQSAAGWHTTIQKQGLVLLGLDPERIISGQAVTHEEVINGERHVGHNNALQVTATPRYVTVRSFDYRSGNGSLVDVKEAENITLIKL